MTGFISSAPIDVQFSCFQFLVMKSEAVSIFIFPSFPLLGCVSKELRNWKGCIFSYTKLTPEFHPGLCLLVLEPTDLHLLQPLPMWDIYMLSAYRYERGSRSVFSAFLWFLVRLSCPQVLLVVGNSCEALLFFWASVFICKIQMLSYFMWTHCAWLMSVLIRTHPPHFVLGVCSVSHTSFPLSPFALHVGFSSCVLSSGSVIYMDLPRKWTVFSLLCWFLRDRLDVVWTTSLSSYVLTLVWTQLSDLS